MIGGVNDEREARERSDDGLHLALGQVVRIASTLDHYLRVIFSILVASPAADVLSAGQMTRWLIEACEALTKHNPAIDEGARRELKDLLDSARVLSDQRNRFVHDVWMWDVNGLNPAPMRSRRLDPALAEGPPVTQAGLQELAINLSELCRSLGMWMGHAARR